MNAYKRWIIGMAGAMWIIVLACGNNEFGLQREGMVQSVVDGDTVLLSGGERVRILMVDAPEMRTTSGSECYAKEAQDFVKSLVLNQWVDLQYDKVRRDVYGRMLAYIVVNGRDVSSLIVERGFGRVMYIPPNGKDRYGELMELENNAKEKRRGIWGACR